MTSVVLIIYTKMIRALYNCISNTETWVIQYYSCFSPKTQFTVSLWTHHDNRYFTEPTSTHHHAAHLKLYLLFKIISLYAADYNTDFTIGLLFLTDGTSDNVCVCDYRSYFEWMIETGPSVVRQEKETVLSTRRQSKVLHLVFIWCTMLMCLAIEVVTPLYNK